jgi:hypothetical protein
MIRAMKKTLPDWRDEFPPEGPTTQEPIERRERYIALRLGEVSLAMESLRREGLREGTKESNQRLLSAIKAAEGQLRTVMEMARLLKVNSEGARKAAGVADKGTDAILRVLTYQQGQSSG